MQAQLRVLPLLEGLEDQWHGADVRHVQALERLNRLRVVLFTTNELHIVGGSDGSEMEQKLATGRVWRPIVWCSLCYLGGGAADQGEAREVDDGVHDHAAQAGGRVEVLLHGAGEVQAARVDAHHLI